MAHGKGYVAVSRKVIAEQLGRSLTENEIVLHKNGDRLDNNPENLRVVARNYGFKPNTTEYRKGIKKGFTFERGYAVIWNPKHPMARKTGYVLEHRLIMAEHLGRILQEDEHVHHKNGNRLDNRIRNLEIVDKEEHPLTYKEVNR